MSRFAITIGKKTFPSKKSATKFYKDILDSYNFGEKLNNSDAEALIVLVATSEDTTPAETLEYAQDCIYGYISEDEEYNEWFANNRITGVVVDRHPDFRTTKCFFFLEKTEGKNEKNIFSYRAKINGYPTDIQRFSRACRFTVYDRIRKFKMGQFKNRPVKCVISGEIVEWEECQVDHKSPLTFSVIVKSFIIANNLDIAKIEYTYSNSREKFVDESIAKNFDEFHKNMAVLRIISTKENLKLSGSARVKPTKKDGILKD